MRLKNTAIKKARKTLCVVVTFLALNCAPPKIAQNVPQKATEPAIKLLRVETSQYSQLKTRVLLRDGSDDYNRWLSERRAESVRDFFASLGMPSKNMKLKEYGDVSPIALNDTAENRYLNRRVEIKILDILN
ncbi:OmpA family protein [candidate division KSB1 bacterium]|nr:OmpA family protein [candidate division KSB1 bacterium]MBL7094750.1 OmpA family protein [candidate division KSB1 bacterium]